MHEDMHTLLNAYLDGELHGWRLQAFQTHLDSCAACQNELKELRHVSDLLQADSAPEVLPVDRFVSQLTLHLPRPVPQEIRDDMLEPGLPRRTDRDRLPQPVPPAWWLVPAGLLGAWFFVQTVFTLTNIVSMANLTGLLGQATHWLGGGQETIWFNMATSLIGRQGAGAQLMLSLMNNVSVFGATLFSGFLWQAVIGLLFWAWLLLWWRRGGHQPLLMRNGS
jgi:hypothetical protein